MACSLPTWVMTRMDSAMSGARSFIAFGNPPAFNAVRASSFVFTYSSCLAIDNASGTHRVFSVRLGSNRRNSIDDDSIRQIGDRQGNRYAAEHVDRVMNMGQNTRQTHRGRQHDQHCADFMVIGED